MKDKKLKNNEMLCAKGNTVTDDKEKIPHLQLRPWFFLKHCFITLKLK